MKTIILTFAIIIILVISSCEKTSEEHTVDELIEQLLINPDDDDETKFNMDLLKTAFFIDTLLKESDTKLVIIDELKTKKVSEISLKSLANNINEFNLKSANAYDINLKNSQLKFKNNIYAPNIYIPNIETLNPELEPIIAIGSDINDTENPDEIIGWYYNNSRKKELIFLSEKTAMESVRPIIIVNAASTNDETPIISVNNEFGSFKSTSNITTIKATIDEYKISERYDKSNRSEYSYELLYIYNNGGMQYGGDRTEIKEIHKSDINKLFTGDFEIWQLNYLSNVQWLGMVTFEYDWYASKKPVSLLPYVNANIECRMKFYDEWYQILVFELIEGTIVEKISKGSIKIKM